MSKWAVVLCGGRGSRMGTITDTIPKPLVEVHGKPIIWYSILKLHKHGFKNFIFPLGYKGEMIKEYLEKEFRGLDLLFLCRDTGEDTPPSQRIYQIKDMIPDHEDFFLLNSDTIFDFNISAMYAKHKRSNALLTLSSVQVVSTWGLIQMRQGFSGEDEIIGFDRERKIQHVSTDSDPNRYGLINSGLAFLNKDALDVVDLNSHINFENVLYQILITAGRAAHFELRGVWYPIDTQKDLDIVNMLTQDAGHSAQMVKKNLETTIYE
jgi:glucose-1-phosphate cytidylyltransferase